MHYPEGWQLTIDGEPADLLRVNYALRGVVVPTGTHTVEMAFVLPAVQSARTVASLGSGLLLLFVLGTLAMAFLGRGKVEEVS